MRDYPIIRSLEQTGLPPWNDGREPRCPVCGASCDTVYRNAEGDTVGAGDVLVVIE